MPYIAWLVQRYAIMFLNFKSLAFSYIKTRNPEKYLNYIKRSQFLLNRNHLHHKGQPVYCVQELVAAYFGNLNTDQNTLCGQQCSLMIKRTVHTVVTTTEKFKLVRTPLVLLSNVVHLWNHIDWSDSMCEAEAAFFSLMSPILAFEESPFL